jgi:pyruvate/2-oxoglutarate dehydrogenase complex dihydrolipoamide dehydrogenase (E3) component
MKALVGDSDYRILGLTMIDAAADEVMAVVQAAILFKVCRCRFLAPKDG